MASAATASAPTPPTTATTAAAATASSTFSRMSEGAVSALLNAAQDVRHSASSASSLSSSSSPRQRSLSSRPATAPLSRPTPKMTATPLNAPAPAESEGCTGTSLTTAIHTEGHAAAARSLSSTSSVASSSTASSSWTAAARNASLAPYRVLAAALPSLLNVSPGTSSGVGSSSSSSSSGSGNSKSDSPAANAVNAPGDDAYNVEQEAAPAGLPAPQTEDEQSEDGLDSGVVTAWQTPEMGATLQMVLESPSARPIQLPSAADRILRTPHASTPALGLLHALTSAAAPPSIPAPSTSFPSSSSASDLHRILRRPSAGLASLVHVHETTSASDSDWDDGESEGDDGQLDGQRAHSAVDYLSGGGVIEDDDDDDDNGGEADDAGSMDMAYHDDTIRGGNPLVRNSATAARKQRHRRQRSAFFSISSAAPPSIAEHAVAAVAAGQLVYHAGSVAHGAAAEGGVGLLPPAVIAGEASEQEQPGEESMVTRTPSTSTTASMSIPSSSSSSAPSAASDASSSSMMLRTTSLHAPADGNDDLHRPGFSSVLGAAEALGLGIGLPKGDDGGAAMAAAAGGPEIAAEDEFSYYRVRPGVSSISASLATATAGAASTGSPATSVLEPGISTSASTSDRATSLRAASTIGLNTPHPSLLTLHTARPSSSHAGSDVLPADDALPQSSSSADEAYLVASPVEMDGSTGAEDGTRFFASTSGPVAPAVSALGGAVQTPKQPSSAVVGGLARVGSAFVSPDHSTPGTVVPGNATLVPASPELDSPDEAGAAAPGAVSKDGPKPSTPSTSTSPQAAQQRQQLVLKRAEHRRELQRLALLELVRTERSYADDLALLVMVFFENLVVLPAFASNANSNASTSDLGRSDSRSGTDEGGEVMAHSLGGSGSGAEERAGGAAGGGSVQGISNSGTLHPAPMRTRSSSSQAMGSDHAISSPHSDGQQHQQRIGGSVSALRNHSDPALERLDLVTRNAEDLLSLHQSAAWRLEAIVSQYGLDHPESDPNVKVKVSASALEEGTRKVAEYLANTLAPALRELYAPFCSRHMEALGIVKEAERRSGAEWMAYERTCAEILQVVAARMSPMLPSPSPTHPTAGQTNDAALSTASMSTAATPGAASSSSSSSSSSAVGEPVAAAASPSPIAPLLNGRSKTHKLVFHDYFVKPIQRIALYPLLLQSLLKYCSQPAPALATADVSSGTLDVSSEVEASKLGSGKDREAVRSAVEALVGAVEHVNEAGRLRLEERLSQTIVDRIEVHYNVTPSFLHSLGHCAVSGTLDVLYHQRHSHPLSTQLRLKYLGCVLYQGFVLIVKVRKSATYELKFWFPLWLAKLSDVPEEARFLPHAFRLSVRDHHFELVASNARERQLWVEALGDAISKAPFTPPGLEPAFPSSLFLDSAGVGGGDAGPSSRPSSRATQRPSSRHSMHAPFMATTVPPPPVPAIGLDAEAMEELDAAPAAEASPRKGRFSTSGASTLGRSSTPSSPSAPLISRFDSSSSLFVSPGQEGAEDGSGEDVLQQYFDETSEIQVRRSSPYQRSVIDRAMAFSANVVAARAPRSAHDAAGMGMGGAFGSLALGNAFALSAPAHGPGWQQSLGALVGLGRMGSMETSKVKVSRRKSCAGNVEGLPAFLAAEGMLTANGSSIGAAAAASSQNGGASGSTAVPFPVGTPGGSSQGMSNRAMKTWRQLSLKTVSRTGVRPMSEVFPSPGSSGLEGGNSNSGPLSESQQLGEPVAPMIVIPPRQAPSRRESFANSLRDALTVSFGRRQRSQSSQEIENESFMPSIGTEAGSSGFTSGAQTPFLSSMQHSPSMHASLSLTPVTADGIANANGAEAGALKSTGRAESIRRVFGSMRTKRERTLSMPVAPEPQLVAGRTAIGQVDEHGVSVPQVPTGMTAQAMSSAAASRDSLVANGAGLQVTLSRDEEGVAPQPVPPLRSYSRASLSGSRIALSKIWFGGSNGGAHSSSSDSTSSSGSGFLSVGGLVRPAQPGRRSTDSFASSRSKSALALPTYPRTTEAAPAEAMSRSVPASAGGSLSGSPNEAQDGAVFFSAGDGSSSSSSSNGVGPVVTAVPLPSPSSSSSGNPLTMRRPRLNLKLTSSHRLSNVMPPLPTLPATPAEEAEMPLSAASGAPVSASS
ncbi:hypothetical protein OC842_006534 [Tilletia horrida]|uniref:DH domain-containing protein n=1 Tax=Tilletia horrida TaxID=155126 RepID=A0AAN6G817_9BASI|nr:hypothetical protein OC842_006534 [Tilletia horrida]